MICPKCGHENSPDRADCSRCGVIFARIRPVQAPAERSAASAGSVETEADTASDRNLWVWAAALLIMTVWGSRLIFVSIDSNTAGESLLHLVNLPFHEAGHVFMRPFGQFMTTLGGTLAQLLVPLICLAVLLFKSRDALGAVVCGWWFGENLLDIAPYIADARAGELPLVGGNFGASSPYGFHDWEYLLTETGLLRYDHALARIAHVLGALLMLLAVVWGGWLFYKQSRRSEFWGKS